MNGYGKRKYLPHFSLKKYGSNFGKYYITSDIALRHWRRSGVVIVNFNIFYTFFSVSFVDFEQVNVSWVLSILRKGQ